MSKRNIVKIDITKPIKDYVEKQKNEVVAAEITEKQRNKIDKGDFLFPSEKSFPVNKRSSIKDALHDWARAKHGLTYEQFVKKLYNHVKNKHPEWLSEFPDETLKKAGIKKS